MAPFNRKHIGRLVSKTQLERRNSQPISVKSSWSRRSFGWITRYRRNPTTTRPTGMSRPKPTLSKAWRAPGTKKTRKRIKAPTPDSISSTCRSVRGRSCGARRQVKQHGGGNSSGGKYGRMDKRPQANAKRGNGAAGIGTVEMCATDPATDPLTALFNISCSSAPHAIEGWPELG
jgi:hypothetical protein